MFKGNLLDFQAEDVQKLKSKRSRLIGNEPGTGKTYEAIALDQLNRAGDGNSKVDLPALFPNGKGMKTLIICPKSVLSSWDEHLMELTSEDNDIYLVDLSQSYQRKKKGIGSNRWRILKHLKDPKTSGYFIVTWDFIRLERDELEKVDFFHIIADEVHKAKGKKAQQTTALKALRAIYKTGLSGTPADDKPQDLWSILNWLWPNYYTAYWAFVKAYVDITTDDEGYRKLGAPKEETIHLLHAEMEPWFTRRRKKDVLKDLPDKYYSRIWVDLHPKQRKAYDQMKKVMAAWVEQHQDEIDREDPIICQAVTIQLIRLQQFACGYVIPRLDGEGNYVYRRIHKGHPRGQCPFPDLPLGELDMEGVFDWVDVNGKPYKKKAKCRDQQLFDVTDPSAKLDAVMEWLENRDDQVAIWSQYKSVVYLLEQRLIDAGIPYSLITGDTTQAQREETIQAFQSGKSRVYIGTIEAGGEGIQLQCSSTSLFIDRTWKPSKNTQAEDRQHRIGQDNAVQVIDIMARNTVDLGRAQKIAMKAKHIAVMLGDEVDQDHIANIMQGEPVYEFDEGEQE